MSKRYNKKKMMSLLMMPWVATMSIGKPVMAAYTSVNSGDSPVNIAGTVYDTSYYADSDDVSIVLDSGAALDIYNTKEASAIDLQGGDSGVTMNAGSSISNTDYASFFEAGINTYRGYDAYESTQVSMDAASITVDYADYSNGIYVFDHNTYDNETDISLTNASSIEATGGTEANGIFLGSYQDQSPYYWDDPENDISLSSSTIISIATGEGSTSTFAAGINVYNYSEASLNIGSGETTIDIDDASMVSASSTASNESYVYADSAAVDLYGAGAVRVTIDNGSSAGADSTAYFAQGAYATAAGVRSDSIYNEAVSVTIDESSSLEATATAKYGDYLTANADGVEMTAAVTQGGLFGGFSVELDRASSITATATTEGPYSYGYLYSDVAKADADGIYLEIIGGEGNVSVDLDQGSSVTASANAGGGYDYSLAKATGVAASSDYDGYPDGGDVSISLDKGSSVSATASASSLDTYTYSYYNNGQYYDYDYLYGGDATAVAVGLDTTAQTDDYIFTDSPVSESAIVEGAAQNANVLIDLDDSDVSATAMAEAKYSASASAIGIDSFAYFDTTITLYNSSVTASATATDYYGDNALSKALIEGAGAYAAGILGGEGATSLDAGSSVLVSADHTSVYGEGYASGIGIRGSHPMEEVSIALNDSSLSVTASATGGDGAIALAGGASASSDYYDASVDFDNSPLTVSATATSTSSPVMKAVPGNMTFAFASGAGAFSDYGESSVSLSNLTATIDADATAFFSAYAIAEGVQADADYYSAEITLDTVTLGVSATATSEVSLASAFASGADASSFYSDSGDYYGDDATISVTDSTLNVSATAEGKYAEASVDGLSAYAYDFAGISIDGSTVTLTASATSELYSGAVALKEPVPEGPSFFAESSISGFSVDISGEGGLVELAVEGYANLSINDSTVSLEATATSMYGEGSAYASGGSVESSYVDNGPRGRLAGDPVSIEMNDSTMTVDSYVMAYDYANSRAIGLYGESFGGVTVTLNSATLNVYSDAISQTDSTNSSATGIRADAQEWNFRPYGGPATVDLYNGSLKVQSSSISYNSDNDYAWDGAEGVEVSAYDDAAVYLDNFTLDAIALATADVEGRASASANGISIWNKISYDGAEVGGEGVVTLFNAPVNADARAYGYWNGRAYASGVRINSSDDTYFYGYNSNVTATAVADSYAQTNSATATASVFDAYSYSGPNYVELDNLTFQADATATDTFGNAEGTARVITMESGGDAELYTDYVDLYANASATTVEGDATAESILVDIFPRYDYNYNVYYGGSATVELNDGTLSAQSTATTSVEGKAEAYATGLDVYQLNSVNVEGENLAIDINATATAQYANAESNSYGILASNYYDSNDNVEVTLDNSSLTVSAYAQNKPISDDRDAEAFATGIDVYASRDGRVDLDYTDVTVTADANGIDGAGSGDGGDAYVGAYGIAVDSYYDDARVYLTNLNVTVSATGYGEDAVDVTAEGIDVYASQGSNGSSDANADVRAEGVALMVTASATSVYASTQFYNYSYAGAEGFAISAFTGEGIVNINLDDSSVTASFEAEGDDALASGFGIDAYGYYGVDVDLYNTNLSVESVALANGDSSAAYAYANAYAYAIDADSNDDYVDVSVEGLDILSSAKATSSDDYAYASADGIDADAFDNDARVELFNVNLDALSEAKSTGDYAVADSDGIEAYTYYDGAEVSLSSSTLDVISKATSSNDGAYAGSEAIEARANAYFGNAFADVYAYDSAIVSSATATGGYADAYADGIYADGYDYADVDLYNVTLNVMAVATANSDTVNGDVVAAGPTAGAAYATTVGIEATANRYDTYVDVEGSSVVVLSQATSKHGHADAYAWGIGAYADDVASVDLYDDATVTVTAKAQGGDEGYTYAEAWGVWIVANGSDSTGEFFAENSTITINAMATGENYPDAYASGIYVYSDKYNTVDLDETTVVVNATATTEDSYSYAEARGVEMNTGKYADLNMTDSTVTVSAAANGSYAWSAGALIWNDNPGGQTTVTLNSATLSASSNVSGSDGYAFAGGLITEGSAPATIDLFNDSSIIGSATEGTYGMGGFGVAILNNDEDTYINVDETSMIFGSNYAVFGGEGFGSFDSYFVPVGGNVTLNNDGLVAGRVMVDNLYNNETGTLWAALSSEDRENRVSDNYDVYDPAYYFTALNNATLAEGSAIEIYAEDDLGFSKFGEEVALNMVESINDNGSWDPDTIEIVQSGFSSPLLVLEYSEDLSTPGETFVVSAQLQQCGEAGISENACRAAQAALQDGILGFNSDPEEWFPDPSRANLAGTQLLIKSNLHSIDSRLAALITGENSGDEPGDKGLWINLLYSDAEQDDRNRGVGFDGYEADTTGVIVGFDGHVNDSTIMGVAVTYGTTDADAETNLAEFDMDEYLFTLYGDYECPESDWFGKAQLTYGMGEVDSERTNAGFVLKGSYDTDVIYGRVEMGKHIGAGSWVFSPQASIDYALIQFDKYTEKGGFLPLEVAYQDYDEMNIGVGAKLAKAEGMFRPEVKAVVYYDVIGDDLEAKSNFVGSTTKFLTQGADSDEFSWDLGVGLTIGSDDSPISFKVGYDLIGSEDFSSHNFNGKLRYEF